MKIPLKKIKKYYRSVVKNFDKEEVHKFRVEVKKFRALVRLISYNKHGVTCKIPKAVNSLYKLTGNVRNLDLQLERVLQFSFKFNVWPKNYISFLGSSQQAWTNKEGKFKHKHAYNASEANQIRNEVNHFDKNKMKAYSFHQAGLLQNLLLIEHFEENDLHQLRKFLKDILYNWKFIKWVISPLLPFFIQKKQALIAFTVLLGDFQDVCVALELSDLEYYPHLSSEEESVVDKFRGELEQQKLHLKKRILNEIAPSKFPWHPESPGSFVTIYTNALT